VNRVALPAVQFPFGVGDELVAVDGQPVQSVIASLRKYAVAANPRTTDRLAAGYVTDRFQQIMPHAPAVPDTSVVTVRVVVSFPRWTHPRAAPASLVAAWNRYTRALARHEQGHVDYAVGRRAAVARAIKRATCGSANAAALKQLDVIRKHDVAYDRSTQHGATQGARFP